ncbi:MAG: hypothetical protein LBH95_02710 [Oscillospiraceae bacterium]|jgi:hypothetical protein|nr:hypothetical protein [Oscillospiraceae bacterium]
MAGAQKNPSWTLAEYAFHLVSGDFTIITDGVTFGLPAIKEWVGSNTGINNSDAVGPSRGSLAEKVGRAVIQRPLEWDRTSGEVTAWDTYILSEADTTALGIDIKSVGQKIRITFRHPDWEWENYTQGNNHRPGQQHRKPVQKIYGGVKWLSEIKETIGIDGTAATLFNGMSDRVFLDYSNDWAYNGQIITKWAEDNTNEKLEAFNADYNDATGPDGKEKLRIKKDVWQNADVRVITDDGRTSFVFIENYIVGRITDVGDNITLTSGGIFNALSNTGGKIEKWQIAGNMGYSVSWAKGDYMAVCPIIGNDDWGSNAAYSPNNFLVQEVPDKENGPVTSVRYDADDYTSKPGSLADNGTGYGDMILGGKTYVMSDSWRSHIFNFNSYDNHETRTIVLWHGQVVEIIRGTTPDTFCVVAAAGAVRSSSYNLDSVEYKIDIVTEDGQLRKGLEIEKIFPLTSTGYATSAAQLVKEGALTAKTYGPVATPTVGGRNPISYRGEAGLDTPFSEAASELEGHVFRYSLNGNKVALYEVKGQDAPATPDDDGKVEGTRDNRFNATWGDVLGSVPSMNERKGLILSAATVVIVKTTDKNTGEARYNVYNRSVPGYTVTGGNTIKTETLRGNESGGLGDYGRTGPYVRFTYIDASKAEATGNAYTRWAVALAVGYDITDPESKTRIGTIKAMVSGNKDMQLRTIAYDTAGYNALKLLSRGDVFTYESEDGSPEKISEINVIRSDALINGLDNSGYFSVISNVKDDGKWVILNEAFWGSFGQNYVVGNKKDDGPISTSELRTIIGGFNAGAGDSDVYNLYIFNSTTTKNYSNATEALVVGYDRKGDQRDINGRLADAVAAIENMNPRLTGYANEPTLQNAILSQISAILEQYGCTAELAAGGTIAAGSIVVAGFGTSDVAVTIPALKVYCHEAPAATVATFTIGLSKLAKAKAAFNAAVTTQPILDKVNLNAATKAVVVAYMNTLTTVTAALGDGTTSYTFTEDDVKSVTVTTPSSAGVTGIATAVVKLTDGDETEDLTFTFEIPAATGKLTAAPTTIADYEADGTTSLDDIVITVVDVWGDPIAAVSVTVTTTATITGTASVASAIAAAGDPAIATFDDLVLDAATPDGSVTLSFAATGYEGATVTVTVVTAPPAPTQDSVDVTTTSDLPATSTVILIVGKVGTFDASKTWQTDYDVTIVNANGTPRSPANIQILSDTTLAIEFVNPVGDVLLTITIGAEAFDGYTVSTDLSIGY